jgi:predicted nucleic acid-binding protein
VTVLVDTDVFSYLWAGRPEAAQFADQVAGQVAALSFTTVGELYFGAASRGWGRQRVADLDSAIRPYLILPYSVEMARLWGMLKADVRRRGLTVPDNDLWIGATALHYEIPLLTNNRRHFEQIDRLVLLPRVGS